MKISSLHVPPECANLTYFSFIGVSLTCRNYLPKENIIAQKYMGAAIEALVLGWTRTEASES